MIKKSKVTKSLILVGISLILLMLLVAILAPIISPQDPNLMSLQDRYQGPSLEHPFGLDENGSDVLAKVAYGARVSLTVSLSVVSISLIIGLMMGSLAGYYGKKWETFVMRVIDMIQAFPSFLLALALVAVLGPSIRNVIIAMCLTGWSGFARLVRGEILHLKEKEFVTSARAIGSKDFRILFYHIWPNLVGALLVNASFAMAGTIIAESGLSFLGLGAPPTTPTWGALLNSGRKILLEAPHVSLFPGLAIFTLILGFNLLGDGLRDYLDPKAR
jgi:peptide/nickel transport system permease protein